MRNPMQGRQPNIGKQPDKAKNTWQTVRRLLPYWQEHWATMLGMMACSVLSVCVTLGTPIMIGKAIDDCLKVSGETIDVDLHLMGYYLVTLAVLYLVGAASQWAQEVGMTVVAQRIVGKLRQQMMDHMVDLDVKYYDQNSRGDLLSRFSNDAELIKEGMGQMLIQVVTTVVSMVGMIAAMCVMSLSLTMMVCLSIPMVLILTKVIVTRSRRYFGQQQESLGRINSVIEESIVGLRVIRSLGREEDWRKKFEAENVLLRTNGTKAQINSGLLMPMLRVLDNMTYIMVAVAGGLMAVKGVITVGVIQTFLLYTRHFLRPVNQIATQMNTVQSAFAGAERVFALMDVEPRITNKPNALKPAGDVKGEVRFENVTFGYDDDKMIIHDVSFTAKPGQVVAIVGGTGAGKTTLMNLLVRFYDCQEGRVMIDGHDIKDYDITYLRDSMAIVLQDPILFSDTVRSNISYGDPARPALEDVRQSAQMAMAETFIERLPEGYETQLVRQGENISNGQKQLLTIARAIHSNAPMLVLDEATSNIDTHTEMLLQQAIGNLTKGRTCFMIAHRLSTIRNADNILVMDKGRLVEQGTHDELLARGGVYRKIYDSQFNVGTGA